MGIDADFCDMEPNGCATTDPGCDTIAPGEGIKEFCSCSSLKVPDYAPVSVKNIPLPYRYLEDLRRKGVKIYQFFFTLFRLVLMLKLLGKF